MPLLQKLEIRHSEYVIDAQSGRHVFHVCDPHALIQAAGYLKHTVGAQSGRAVYFRGQPALYGGLVPGIFRGCASTSAQTKRLRDLNALVDSARRKSRQLASLPSEVTEALLQHYGIRTTWVDLVENVWVALWFACHRARLSGKLMEFQHFERRQHRQEDPESHFGYVLLVAPSQVAPINGSPGFSRGPGAEVVDLRTAAPSTFVRPHAQHGVLFRLRDTSKRPSDYISAVVGILRVDLRDALEWLGGGNLLTIHGLFPPPAYDHGYHNLLHDFRSLKVGRRLGSIVNVGA